MKSDYIKIKIKGKQYNCTEHGLRLYLKKKEDDLEVFKNMRQFLKKSKQSLKDYVFWEIKKDKEINNYNKRFVFYGLKKVKSRMANEK